MPATRELEGGGSEIGCFYSDDRGESFAPSDVWLNSSGTALSFPTVVSLDDSRVAMYAGTVLHRIYRSVSEDHGITWKPATEITRLISPLAPGAFTSDEGSLLAIWNRNSRGAIGNSGRANEVAVAETHGGDRINLTIAISYDDGNDWSVLGTIASEIGKTYSYPAIHKAHGRTLVSYNVGERSADGALATNLVIKEIVVSK